MLHFLSEAQKSKAVVLFQPEGEFASRLRRSSTLQGVLQLAIERPLTCCEVSHPLEDPELPPWGAILFSGRHFYGEQADSYGPRLLLRPELFQPLILCLVQT